MVRIINYFIADLHFGHDNIIKFDGRPFENIELMNEQLITNWNETVHKKDNVYVLGDMFMKIDKDQIIAILKQLKGNIHIILGNHEKHTLDPEVRQYFKTVSSYKELQVFDNENKAWNVRLSHYPMVAFNGGFEKNTIHLYGHVHNTVEQQIMLIAKHYQQKLCTKNNPNIMLSCNVGCMLDHMAYKPQPIEVLVKQAIKENKQAINMRF